MKDELREELIARWLLLRRDCMKIDKQLTQLERYHRSVSDQCSDAINSMTVREQDEAIDRWNKTRLK